MEGTVLKGRWKIVKKIGQGAFGEIYSGADLTTKDPIAVKVERWDNKKVCTPPPPLIDMLLIPRSQSPNSRILT
jgi:hypothetical protein